MTTATETPTTEQAGFEEPTIPSREARKLVFDLQYVFREVPALKATEGNIRTIVEALTAIGRY